MTLAHQEVGKMAVLNFFPFCSGVSRGLFSIL